MITVIAVNYNTFDWMRLLVASVRRFADPVTRVPTEVLIVDNASTDGSREWLAAQKDVYSYCLNHNIGHGKGLDFALRQAATRFVLVLDIDAHVQRYGWDVDLIRLYQSGAPKRRLIAAKGGEEKPIHPCFMFFERRVFRDMQLSFVPTPGYDVGRKIYYDLEAAGFETLRVAPGYESGDRKYYPDVFGTEYYVYSKPTVYHQWYSARMSHVADGGAIDNYAKADFMRDKERLFSMPLVRDILTHGE